MTGSIRQVIRLKIYVDTNQQDGKHETKHRYLISKGYELVFLPLPEGDYILENEKIESMLADKDKRKCKVVKNDISGLFDVSVDTKRNIQEIIGNICGKGHARFHDECARAMNKGLKFYILIENEDGVKTIDDLETWDNPRIARWKRIKEHHEKGRWGNVPIPKRPPTSGEGLAKSMRTMEKRYGVKFLFCRPEEAGRRVVELLTGEEV